MDRELLNYTQNRELSWLRFDQRVLEEARDKSVPLLERMKFVAIFTSNLDEFFMIRVGSLYDMVQTDEKHRDSRSGMTPQEQLDAIYEAVAPLYKERDKTYTEIKKELSPYGVCGLDFKELEADEKKYVKKYFKEQILPVLSPQIVDSSHPFPHLLNKDIYVTASLNKKEQMLGIVPVPTYVSDILMLPGHDIRYIRMEKVIMEYLHLVFDQYEVSDPNYICVTRNADVSPNDEALEVTDDFRKLMQNTLHKRRRMAVVRLETAEKLSAKMQEYLCAAAENGKEVTVLIELRARFDEQNNIDWSERLEEADCRVIYGFDGYKVHSKICLITYRNRNEIQYITQVGTGNYNEKTAAMYTDLSLMTADPRIGQDAAEFFKNMSIGNLQGSYQYLIVSPVSLKSSILQMMDEEIRKGKDGRIVMKMNSVTDVDFIRKVSEASRAGVRVDLIVRGICCILPGVPEYTETVRVMSVVGRYLEHPRIFSFGTGKEQKIYIGSADMMTRNTEKRVEVACPVLDEQIRRQINHDLKVMLSDNVKVRVMQKDGTYTKRKLKDESSGKMIDSQAVFMEEALKAAEEVQKKEQAKAQKKSGGFATNLVRKILHMLHK